MSKSNWLALCAICALAGCDGATPPSLNGPFSRLVIFGDSICDTGNLWSISSGFLPSAPYFEGRFCNAPNWVDRLAAHLRLDARAHLQGGTNYSFGASASGRGLGRWEQFALGPNQLEQVRRYDAQPDGSELFVLWFGGVDAVNAAYGYCNLVPESVADNVAAAARTLYDRGARYFMVVNVPDFGLMPRLRPEPLRTQVRDLCNAINVALEARLDELEQLPDITVYRLDAAAMHIELNATPPAGITNVDQPAWTGAFLGYLGGIGELSPEPDVHLYWDELHPGAAWHQALADRAVALIDARPPAPRDGPPPPSAQPQTAFALLRFWLDYFALTNQPPASSDECRF